MMKRSSFNNDPIALSVFFPPMFLAVSDCIVTLVIGLSPVMSCLVTICVMMMFQGAEMVVLPAVLHLHLPDGHPLCPGSQGLRLTLLQKGPLPISFPIIYIRKMIKLSFHALDKMKNPYCIDVLIQKSIFPENR